MLLASTILCMPIGISYMSIQHIYIHPQREDNILSGTITFWTIFCVIICIKYDKYSAASFMVWYYVFTVIYSLLQCNHCDWYYDMKWSKNYRESMWIECCVQIRWRSLFDWSSYIPLYSMWRLYTRG